MVGRGKELSQLTAAVLDKRGAVITGTAGVGKTTLAVACLKVAESRGISLARTTATRASRGLPFGAFAPMLPADSDEDEQRREDHGALLRRYARAIVERAQKSGLVVFVDDAHLLDDGSATLFHQLALTGSATVLATVRSDELAPDAVVELWKDGPAERVAVDVLADSVIEELLPTVLGGPVDAAALRQLTGRARGNPLFLRELVTGALETGTLVDEGGIWRLRGALRPTARLIELAAQRLGELTGPERIVLELLTLGEPLGQAALAQLTDAASVEALEQRGLITSRIEGRRVQVWLAHPVYGDVVRAGISALRQSAFARSRAEVVEALGARRREDALLLASWRLVGGGGSAELLLAGASAAQARHDYPLAERLARAALSEGGGFEAGFVAAEAAHFQGRPEQAEGELAVLATKAGSDAERARVAIVRFDNSYLLHARADFRLIDDVADGVTDPFWRDELSARRLYVMSLSSGPRATVEAGSTFIEHHGSGPPAGTHAVIGYCLTRLGRLDDALALLSPTDREEMFADERGDDWSLFGNIALPLIYAGRLAEAEELLTRANDHLVVGQPTAESRAIVAASLAALHIEQGRPHSAFLRASESYTLFMELGRPFAARWPYAAAAQSLAITGHADQAAETLAALDALGLPTVLPNEADLLQARAAVAFAAGDLPAARRQLEAAADLGQEVGDLIGAARALHGLARLGHASQVAARLGALGEEVDGDLVAARAAYALALAGRDSKDLAKVSVVFEDMGANLYAAEASAEGAVLLRRAGKLREAAAAEQRAMRLLARCEGASTAAVATMTARVRLTPGELDAALQAAAGRTNKEIARDMYLSVRTVESHLQRAYDKLGISGRHELAEALRDRPPDAQERS